MKWNTSLFNKRDSKVDYFMRSRLMWMSLNPVFKGGISTRKVNPENNSWQCAELFPLTFNPN